MARMGIRVEEKQVVTDLGTLLGRSRVYLASLRVGYIDRSRIEGSGRSVRRRGGGRGKDEAPCPEWRVV